MQNFSSHRTFEPVIVDDTAEIDRAVESGHLQLNNIPAIPQSHYRRNQLREDDLISHPESDISTIHRSEPPTPPARPKLSDALERVDDRRERQYSPRIAPHQSPDQSPRARKAPAPVQGTRYDEQVQDQPSIQSKSEASSKFTKLARGLKPEIERERQEEIARAQAQAAARNRNVVIEVPDQSPPERRRPKRQAEQPRAGPSSRVQLPDVTGITLAVDTPVKSRQGYRNAPSPNKSANSEAGPHFCVNFC